MVAHDSVSSGRTTSSTWRREYRLSLALLVAGVVMVIAYLAFGGGAISVGNSPSTFLGGLAIYLIGVAGGMLILLAGTVAYYHRLLLRQSRRVT
jgi:hypothetical protein